MQVARLQRGERMTSENNSGSAVVQQNGFGITSLVTGIVGLPFMFACGSGIILSVIAIVFGALGMKKAKEGQASRGMAVAGLVLGIVGVAWFFIVIFAFGMASIPGATTIN